MIAGATSQKFANATNGAEWSVGGVSLMAGLLLAAEYRLILLDQHAAMNISAMLVDVLT